MSPGKGSRTPIEHLIENARQSLVRERSTDMSKWRELIDRHLRAAMTEVDLDGLASTVQFMCMILDAEGRLDLAQAEIEHAAALASGSRSAAGFLEVMRSINLVALGHIREGYESHSRAEQLLEQAGTAVTRKVRVLQETMRLKLLLEPSNRLEEFAALGGSSESQADYLAFLGWYIPYLAARGDKSNARALIQMGRAAASAQEHRYRLSELRAFERWIDAVDGELPREQPRRTLFRHTAFRETALWLWATSLRRDLGALPDATDGISSALALQGPSDFGGPNSWQAWGQVMVGDGSLLPRLRPPREVSLTTLASALAGAHAIAYAGSREDAAVWQPWVRKLGERGIESCTEWPVARRRIEALLLLRAGSDFRARVAMRDATRWAETHGYSLEAALAIVQASKIESLFGRKNRPVDVDDDAFARDYLVARGIDPLPHAGAVESAALEGSLKDRTILTPRELEVLRLLADDVSYRDAAEILGLSWQTVRTHAHSLYEKLGVSSKHGAAQEARRLGIL